MRLVALLLALPLVGCLSHWSCPPSDSVEWTDPAVYGRLPPYDVENVASYAVTTAEALGEPEGYVHTVWWHGRDGFGDASVDLRGGTIEALSTNASSARAALEAFLRAYSLAGPEADAKLVDEAMASGQPIRSAPPTGPASELRTYVASTTGPWAFDALFANATRLPDHDNVGRAEFELENEAGRVSVWYPLRRGTIAGFSVRADADGQVETYVGDREGRSPSSSVERVRAAFEPEGLVVPADARVTSPVC